VLLERGLVQFGTGQEGGHDQVSEEVVGEPDEGLADLAQLQRGSGLELLVQDVDWVVFVDFQQTLEHRSSHVSAIFLLGLLQDLVEGLHLFPPHQDLGHDLLALSPRGDVGNNLVYHIRLYIFFRVLEPRTFPTALLFVHLLLFLHRPLALLTHPGRSLEAGR